MKTNSGENWQFCESDANLSFCIFAYLQNCENPRKGKLALRSVVKKIDFFQTVQPLSVLWFLKPRIWSCAKIASKYFLICFFIYQWFVALNTKIDLMIFIYITHGAFGYEICTNPDDDDHPYHHPFRDENCSNAQKPALVSQWSQNHK